MDILKKSYADETENVIDRVSKIHTRENMRLRRKLTKENKKSLAIMDENTNLRNELRKNEIDNSIFLGWYFGLSVHGSLILSFQILFYRTGFKFWTIHILIFTTNPRSLFKGPSGIIKNESFIWIWNSFFGSEHV